MVIGRRLSFVDNVTGVGDVNNAELLLLLGIVKWGAGLVIKANLGLAAVIIVVLAVILRLAEILITVAVNRVVINIMALIIVAVIITALVIINIRKSIVSATAGVF